MSFAGEVGAEESLAPDSIEPLIGVREWRLENGRLVALATDHVWEPGVPQQGLHKVRELAHHGIQEVPGPVPGCGCGIYAWKDGTGLGVNPVSKHQVSGAVKLWGKIVVHKDGYRAEWGQVSALFQMQSPAGVLLDPPEYRELLVALGELYQVPVVGRNPLPETGIDPWGVCKHATEDCKCIMHWNAVIKEWHAHPPNILCFECQQESGGERGHWTGE